MLEDDLGRGRRASGQYLAPVLTNHDSLRLVVLNSCEGARSARTDPFAGVASSLVQQGIPAVIAMQFEITDQASITFAQEFYAAIAAGYPVDEALSAARSAIFTDVNALEWGTPVLYLRAPDGIIFAPVSAPELVKLEPAPLAPAQPEPERQEQIPRAQAQPLREPRPRAPLFPQGFPARYVLPIAGVFVLALLVLGGAFALGLLNPQTGTVQRRGSDNAEMVYVPAGEFRMGSVANEQAGDDEKPQHTVVLDAFWIDRHEVTNAQYSQCVATENCRAPDERASTTRGAYYGIAEFDNYPVITVSWDDAYTYCEWAGKRLPTEAEWEKAARRTDGRVYPWGNEFDQSRLNSSEVSGDTSEVGAYPNGASPYGAFDMAGNVWEWVADWYDANYYANSPRVNPQGPTLGERRTRRGGSWVDNPSAVRAPGRSYDTQGTQSSRSRF